VFTLNTMHSHKLERIAKGIRQLIDYKILITTTVPMIVGTALAFRKNGSVNFYCFLISLLRIYLLEIGANTINECIEYFTGVDLFIQYDKKRV